MHDPILIQDYGDYLERENSARILQWIPSYALFWARYIGNDGRANALPMPDATQEVMEERTILWEHLYTLFESLALCWRLEDRFAELKGVTTSVDYADNLNDWIAFFAHLGRIHDMAEKVAVKIKGENLFAPFDSFNEKRHTVLHYPKVPMRWVDNVLAAPMVGEMPKNWKMGMLWSDLNRVNFEFISNVIADILRELEKVVTQFLYRIIELVPAQLGFKPVVWPKASDLLKGIRFGTVSSLDGEPANWPSGSAILSGVGNPSDRVEMTSSGNGSTYMAISISSVAPAVSNFEQEKRLRNIPPKAHE